MIRVLQISLLTAVLIVSGFGQTEPNVDQFHEISKKVTPTTSVKDIEGLISDAESVYRKRVGKLNGSKEGLAQVNMAFARFRMGLFQILNHKLLNSLIDGEGDVFYGVYTSNSEELEELYNESIEIYERDLKLENLELATAKFEIARMWDSYLLERTVNPDSEEGYRESVRIQEHYLDAYKIRVKLLKQSDENVLITAFYLANSYFRTADFEQSLDFFDRYMAGARKAFGPNSEHLVPALLSSAAIWSAVDDEVQVQELSRQISSINNNEAGPIRSTLYLTPRAKSFDYKGIKDLTGGIHYSGPRKILRGSSGTDVRTTHPRSSIGTNPESSGQRYSVFVVGGRSQRPQQTKVLVRIDRVGNIVTAEAVTEDKKLKKEAEKSVRKWRFRPFVYRGKARPMKGFVYYNTIK